MTDYGRIFGKEVAQGLGLWAPPPETVTAADYASDPADAFTRMAQQYQTGTDVPVPFSQVVMIKEDS